MELYDLDAHDLSSMTTEELNVLMKKLEYMEKAFDAEQMARKISMNSCYGALANAFFIFFDRLMGEAVTISGQATIQWIALRFNEYFEKLTGLKQDVVVGADTDSSYLLFESLVQKFQPESPIDFVSKIAQGPITKYIKTSYKEFYDLVSGYEDTLNMKLEGISDKVIWTGKKNYACRLLENEGVRYAKPKIKIMGMSAVKSSTPEVCRDELRGFIAKLFEKNEEEIQEHIKNFKAEFMKMAPEKVACPTGIKNLAASLDRNGNPVSGSQIHVRAAANYNRLLKQHKLEGLYPEIKSGDKMKYVYLKEPNILFSHVVGFIDKLPPEFGLNIFVDYEAQFERAYLSAVTTLLDAIGWSVEKQSTLDEFWA